MSAHIRLITLAFLLLLWNAGDARPGTQSGPNLDTLRALLRTESNQPLLGELFTWDAKGSTIVEMSAQDWLDSLPSIMRFDVESHAVMPTYGAGYGTGSACPTIAMVVVHRGIPGDSVFLSAHADAPPVVQSPCSIAGELLWLDVTMTMTVATAYTCAFADQWLISLQSADAGWICQAPSMSAHGYGVLQSFRYASLSYDYFLGTGPAVVSVGNG